MAKEKVRDMSFDQLEGLNLNAPNNLDEAKTVIKKKEVEEEPKKDDMTPKPTIRKKKKKEETQETIKTSFKIERDLHLALKQYALIEGEEMTYIVFEKLVKPYLKRKGFYPPRKSS